MDDIPTLPVKTIHERMGLILAELPAIGKGQRNTQQGFMYRGHDDVMNELNPLLSKYQIFFTPRVLERITDQRQTKSGSVMYEVNLLVEYTFWGPAGDSVKASAWGEGTDSGDKSTNKAMTMALKNVLAQTFAVSTAETSSYDSDQHTPVESTGRASAAQRPVAASPAPTPASPPPAGAKKPTKADRTLLANITEELKAIDPLEDWDARRAAYVLQRFEGRGEAELTQAEFQFLTARIEQIRDELVAGGNTPDTFPTPTDEERDAALLEAGIDTPAEPTDDIPFGPVPE